MHSTSFGKQICKLLPGYMFNEYHKSEIPISNMQCVNSSFMHISWSVPCICSDGKKAKYNQVHMWNIWFWWWPYQISALWHWQDHCQNIVYHFSCLHSSILSSMMQPEGWEGWNLTPLSGPGAHSWSKVTSTTTFHCQHSMTISNSHALEDPYRIHKGQFRPLGPIPGSRGPTQGCPSKVVGKKLLVFIFGRG